MQILTDHTAIPTAYDDRTLRNVLGALVVGQHADIEKALRSAADEEEQHSALLAITQFLSGISSTSDVGDDVFDEVAAFLIVHNLQGPWNTVRRRNSQAFAAPDNRFKAFYRLKMKASAPNLEAEPEYLSPLVTALLLRTGQIKNPDWQKISLGLRQNNRAFVRDWTYRSLFYLAPSEEDIACVVDAIKTADDLESFFHEMSIANAYLSVMSTVGSNLAEKMEEVARTLSPTVLEIIADGFTEPAVWDGVFPSIEANTAIFRSDISAFSSRFVMKVEGGHISFGSLGIGLGHYFIIFDGSHHYLLSTRGAVPDKAHIKVIRGLDAQAFKRLSNAKILLLNSNFPRLGDSLDRYSFLYDVVGHAPDADALRNISILGPIGETFVLPTKIAEWTGIKITKVPDFVKDRFAWQYINTCFFRNNVDRKRSFNSKMSRALASNDDYDAQVMTVENLSSNGYFILYFAIEAEKRSFSNQWDVLASAVQMLRDAGIQKIALLNAGLTSSASEFVAGRALMEMDWPQKIIAVLPPDERKTPFVPIDLHWKSIAIKARAILSADLFIGGLVTATLLPSANKIPSLIYGSSVAISDPYRWPSGLNAFFLPAASVVNTSNALADSAPEHLRAQYFSYKADADVLGNRLHRAVSLAVARWESRVKAQ